MKRVQLTVSIVTYQTSDVDLSSVLSCFTSVGLGDCRVYVVDNSPDDRLRHTAEEGGTHYIFNSRNVGFGAAHNQVLRLTSGQSLFHLVINPDVWFDEGVLSELCSFMEANPTVGWIMPRVVYPDGSEQHLCKRLPTPMDLISRRLVGDRFSLVTERNRSYECADIDLSVPRVVPSLSGCFMFLRRAAINDIGYFDERYFIYMEDFDYARRMAAGWDTVYYPHVSIYHKHGRGSYRNRKLLAMHMLAAVKYFNKWGWLFDGDRSRINARLHTDIQSFSTARHHSRAAVVAPQFHVGASLSRSGTGFKAED